MSCKTSKLVQWKENTTIKAEKHIISTDSITIADDIIHQNLTVFNRSQNISKEDHAVDT